MSQIVMFWDREIPSGDSIAGIEIHSNHFVEVPTNACGFRLGLDGPEWDESWYFAEYGKLASTFSSNGIVYSSSFTGMTSPDRIQALGPVHACAAGTYEFQTPLGAFGIAGDDPVIAGAPGAGAFVASFTDESDIVRLDHAANDIEPPDPGTDIEPIELPPKFFDEEAVLQGCVRESLTDTVWCPPDIDIPLPDVEIMVLGRGLVPRTNTTNVALGGGIIPASTTNAASIGDVAEMPGGG